MTGRDPRPTHRQMHRSIASYRPAKYDRSTSSFYHPPHRVELLLRDDSGFEQGAGADKLITEEVGNQIADLVGVCWQRDERSVTWFEVG